MGLGHTLGLGHTGRDWDILGWVLDMAEADRDMPGGNQDTLGGFRTCWGDLGHTGGDWNTLGATLGHSRGIQDTLTVLGHREVKHRVVTGHTGESSTHWGAPGHTGGTGTYWERLELTGDPHQETKLHAITPNFGTMMGGLPFPRQGQPG